MRPIRRCPTCKITLLRGHRAAICENCGKYFDFHDYYKRRKPLWYRLIASVVVALVAGCAVWHAL